MSDSLRPSPKADREDVILGIIAGFATYRMTDRELDLKVALYDEALRSEPAWIIDRARQIFGKGGWQCNWNGNDCPPSASVAAECRFIALPFEAELYRINLILDAELVDNDTTQDERDRAIEAWADLRKEIASTNVLTERTDDEISRERSEMQRANERIRAREAKAKSTQTDEVRA